MRNGSRPDSRKEPAFRRRPTTERARARARRLIPIACISRYRELSRHDAFCFGKINGNEERESGTSWSRIGSLENFSANVEMFLFGS